MTLFETLFAVFFALGVLALIVYFRIRENRYLKKSTPEAISKKLRAEIEEEKAEALRKREKFRETLRNFSGE